MKSAGGTFELLDSKVKSWQREAQREQSEHQKKENSQIP